MAKALGAGMAEAEKDRLRQQEISREKKDIAVGKKINKSDPARKAKLEEDRAARIKANQPKARVTRRQGKKVKEAFPETQTIDKFLDLRKLTDSIRVRKSCKF